MTTGSKTIGQRIATLRKEQGLSQEALGQSLGVSRQAIYKWESDGALPEIDKLITLSRLFSISVGALLGVEEPPTPQEDATTKKPDVEPLSPAQLNMVEEIVNRYLAAQPAQQAPIKKHRILKGIALLIAVIGVRFFYSQLTQLRYDYRSLNTSVANISDSVNQEVNRLTYSLEEIVKSQNNITADYDTELLHLDIATNTATFSVFATPKQYQAGMIANILVDTGTGALTYEATAKEGNRFALDVTVPLSDDITISVSFVAPDGTEQLQRLDEYHGLFNETMPYVSAQGHSIFDSPFFEFDSLRFENLPKQTYAITNQSDGFLELQAQYGTSVELTRVQVGLFKNQELVVWASPCPQPDAYGGDWGDSAFYEFPAFTMDLEIGDTIAFAALVEDNFGRRQLCLDSIPTIVVENPEGGYAVNYVDEFPDTSNLADWGL